MAKLTVYGWQGWRSPAGQTREIVAAHSMAEAARLSGYKRPSQMFNLCETGNEREIAQAMSSPGTVFWCRIDDSYRSNLEWRREDGASKR